MKRVTSIFIILIVLLSILSCNNIDFNLNNNENSGENDIIQISLWTYPVGGWGNLNTVSSLINSFHRDHPNIRVSVKPLDYENGDDVVEEAIKNSNAPDLILEGPERLVANWGARGLMVDIKDLWQCDVADKIYDNVRVACKDSEGRYFIYPMCMTTHCMAINRDLFEASGAWQYIDETTHTWTTENFFKAVEKLHQYGIENVGAVYCGGQGGDQGTRALVNNLYSGTFTNKEHTAYTVNSEENIRALTELKNTDGIVFDPNIVGNGEINQFCNGDLAMAFCWNVSIEVEKTIDQSFDFDVFPMAFPTNDNEVNLQGGIWGFGVFDNGNEARINAAKEFIKYIMQNEVRYSTAVIYSNYLPVYNMPNLYVNDKLMEEYSIFSNYLGDYYQVTPGWANARTAWWKMLQRVGKGDDVKEAVQEFSEKVNSIG